MRSSSQLLLELAGALTKLDDPGALAQTAFATWEPISSRFEDANPETSGRSVERLLRMALERLVESHHSSGPMPIEIEYLDLRYRQHLHAKVIAKKLGYSREHLSRYYRNRALQTLADFLLGTVAESAIWQGAQQP